MCQIVCDLLEAWFQLYLCVISAPLHDDFPLLLMFHYFNFIVHLIKSNVKFWYLNYIFAWCVTWNATIPLRKIMVICCIWLLIYVIVGWGFYDIMDLFCWRRLLDLSVDKFCTSTTAVQWRKINLRFAVKSCYVIYSKLRLWVVTCEHVTKLVSTWGFVWTCVYACVCYFQTEDLF